MTNDHITGNTESIELWMAIIYWVLY